MCESQKMTERTYHVVPSIHLNTSINQSHQRRQNCTDPFRATEVITKYPTEEARLQGTNGVTAAFVAPSVLSLSSHTPAKTRQTLYI